MIYTGECKLEELKELCYDTVFKREDDYICTQLDTRRGGKRKFCKTEKEFWLDDFLNDLSSKECEVGSICLEDQLARKQNRKKRMKWSHEELSRLWSGIALYGNEWREVQRYVACRSYPQVKDKGRRLLQQENWKTGKTKKDTDVAKRTAKTIACNIMKIKASTEASEWLKLPIKQEDFISFDTADVFDEIVYLFEETDE